MKAHGCQSMVAPVRRMLLKHPRDAFISQPHLEAAWRALHYGSCPDFERALSEYARFVGILEQLGVDIHFAPADERTSLDSLYIHDPLVITERGAILCSMGKAARVAEPEAMASVMERLGIPVLGAISGSGRLEGGDVLWLDDRTLAVGQGFRTNAEGLRQLRELLGDAVDEIIPVQLPYWSGPEECLHLLSFISIVDDDLAVVHSRLMPVPFREQLVARGFRFVEVPEAEYDSLGCNVLAVAPRTCVMLSGNPVTQARLDEAGARVWTYDGAEISMKGTGGPTCLTRPVWRAR